MNIQQFIDVLFYVVIFISAFDLYPILFQSNNWCSGYCIKTGRPWVKYTNSLNGIIIRRQRYFGGYDINKKPVFFNALIPAFYKEM